MILQAKSDSKDLESKFPEKALVKINRKFLCLSEIAFYVLLTKNLEKFKIF